jgi:hypothetical protein
MKVTLKTCDYVMEVIKGMKNNEAADTDNLQAECLKMAVMRLKRKQNDGNCGQSVRGRKKHQNGRKGLFVNCVGKEKKWVLQILYG